MLANEIQDFLEFKCHPLGFFVHQRPLGIGTNRRIHVWLDTPSARTGPENDCHQHSFDLSSRVVIGKLENEILAFRESALGETLEFSVDYSTNHSELAPTGKRGDLDLICTFQSLANCEYQLPAGVIHRTKMITLPCVTVVTTVERNFPILSYGANENEQPYLRRKVNHDEAREIEILLKTV